jgi:hypothetical protein
LAIEIRGATADELAKRALDSGRPAADELAD